MNKLKEFRKQRGYVLQRLGVLADVSPATLIAIEKHGYDPKAETKSRIAKALAVEVAAIWPSTPIEAGR